MGKSPVKKDHPGEGEPDARAMPLPDIKPQTPIRRLERTPYERRDSQFHVSDVAPLVGMQPSFIHKVCGRKRLLNIEDVFNLLEQDAFSETFVPRSRVIEYLLRPKQTPSRIEIGEQDFVLHKANALQLIETLPDKSIQCVVTSTPYWAMRIYKDSTAVEWADGSVCPYGHEQTPEEFIRHSAEILFGLYRVMSEDGSIWWNVMDSFNTRTQIRGNAVEALRAMQGKDKRSWKEHDCRRYSAGHAYLKDGEQCLIPSRIAERASRMGYYVKTVITWAKTGTLPEPQETRVSRNLEYILHLSKIRSPKFQKKAYRELPASLGGRNNGWETDKLSDVWTLPTSSGRDGHGAQFPLALPGRCISLSTSEGDIVLDPFVGAGTSGIAALQLGRRFIGIDVSHEYLATARRKLTQASHARSEGHTLFNAQSQPIPLD